MNKNLVYLITVIACILLQFGLAPAVAIAGCAPLLLLIPVVLIALHSGAVTGSIAGFILGLIYDCIYGTVIGCMALILTLLAIGIGFIGRNIDVRSPATCAGVAAVSAVFTELAYGIAVVLTSTDATGVITTLCTHSLPSALYDAVILFVALFTIHLVMEDTSSSSNGIFGAPSGGLAFASHSKKKRR